MRSPHRRAVLSAPRVISVVVTVAMFTFAAQAVTFEVTFTDASGSGFYDPVLGADRREAFQRATDVWSRHLLNPGTIRINVSFAAMGGSAASTPLAEAGPAWIFANFDGAWREGTWYSSAMADMAAGYDLKPGYQDIAVSFNADLDTAGGAGWYYDPQASSGGEIDFQTVAMHEIAHGLGVFSSFRPDGTWGYYGIGMIFDSFLVDSSGNPLIEKTIDPSNVTNGVFWNGPSATAAWQELGGQGDVPIYAPGVWRTGSSLSHLDEETFTGGMDLTTPFYDQAARSIDAVTLGILEDMGWQVDYDPPLLPEPGTVALLVVGFTFAMLRRRRLRR